MAFAIFNPQLQTVLDANRANALGPPNSAEMLMRGIAGLGTSFEGAYERSRERSVQDQLSELYSRYKAPGAAPATGGAPAPATSAGAAPAALPTFAKIEGGAPSEKIGGLISATAATHQLAPDYFSRLVQIESGGNPNAFNSGSKASGLGQFIPDTWKRYGGGASPFDPGANLDATARLTRDNADYLRSKLGREPTQGELYLAHQQGPGAAVKLLQSPDAPVTSVAKRSNVLANLPAGMRGSADSLTAGQFASLWTGKFGEGGGGSAFASARPAGPQAPAPTGGPPATIPPPATTAAPADIERLRAIVANPLSPAPQREWASGELARLGIDAAATGSLPPVQAPGAGTAAPQAVPSIAAAGGGPAMVLPEGAGGPAAPPGSPTAAAAPAPAPAPQPAPPSQPAAAPAAAAPLPAARPAGPQVGMPAGPPPGLPAALPAAPGNAGPDPNAVLAIAARSPQLFAQVLAAQKARGDRFEFMNAGDGRVLRHDKISGETAVVPGLPGAVKAPETVETPGGRMQYNPQTNRFDIPVGTPGQGGYRIIGPNDADARRALNIPDSDKRAYKVDPKGNPEPISAPEAKNFEQENQLSQGFEQNQIVKNYRGMEDALSGLHATFQQGNAQGDLVSVIQLFKAIDPNSTVSQNEVATAQNAGGIPNQLRELYNRALGTGGKFTPALRSQFFNTALGLLENRKGQVERLATSTRNRAKAYQLNPDNAVSWDPAGFERAKADSYPDRDLEGNVPAAKPAPAPAPAAAPTTPAAPPAPPQPQGQPGSSQANPLPISSPAELRNAPSGSWVRYPGFRGQPKIEQVP